MSQGTSSGESVARVDGSTVFVLCDLDMGTSLPVAAAIRAVTGDVVVDLTGVDFIDSTGLRCLLKARRDAEGRGTTVSYVHPQPMVVRLLDITGTRRHLGLADACESDP